MFISRAKFIFKKRLQNGQRRENCYIQTTNTEQQIYARTKKAMNEKFGQMVASSDRKCKIRELMHDDNIDPNECSKQLMKLLVRSITKKISN